MMEYENYLHLAREAKKMNNIKTGLVYYQKVREINPTCAEAKFYYMYYQLWDSTKGDLTPAFVDFTKQLTTIVWDVKEDKISPEEKKELLVEICSSILDLPMKVRKVAHELYRVSNGGSEHATNMFISLAYGIKMLAEFGDDVSEYFAEVTSDIAVPAWIKAVTLLNQFDSGLDGVALRRALPELTKEYKEKYVLKIKEYDSSFNLQEKKPGLIDKIISFFKNRRGK